MWWSEAHVSEDFDLAIRMMAKDYVGRYATYVEGFQEGISLTYTEEEKKVVKFAYGAAEMLLNPFRYWLTGTPFSPLFRKFLWTRNISIFSKVTSSPCCVMCKESVCRITLCPEKLPDRYRLADPLESARLFSQNLDRRSLCGLTALNSELLLHTHIHTQKYTTSEII